MPRVVTETASSKHTAIAETRPAAIVQWTCSLFLGVILLTWSSCRSFYVFQDNPLSKIAAVILIVWLLISLALACHQVASFILSLMALKRGIPTRYTPTSDSKVAILYTCRNDFSESSVESCIRQRHSNALVFVLDDSTSEIERARVDKFVRRLGSQVRLIRRTECGRGYKAGNLNNALAIIEDERFEYFCVIDADEILASDFVTRLVSVASDRSDIAFVQAAHATHGASSFAKCSGAGVDLHWRYFLPARNYSGCMYTYGHGVVFRLSHVMKVGGFPEIISEDVGISYALRAAGYRGLFLPEIMSSEETPGTYDAFRRRSQKVARGTIQLLGFLLRRMRKSDKVPLSVKFDLILSIAVSLLPAAFCTVVLSTSALLVFRNISGVPVPASSALPAAALYRGDHVLAGLATMTIFAPLCFLLPNLIRDPVAVLKFLSRSCALHLSLCLCTLATVARSLARRDSGHALSSTGDRVLSRSSQRWMQIDAAVGLALVIAAIALGSPYIAALGISLTLVPYMLSATARGDYLPPIVSLPFILTIVSALFLPSMAIAGVGILTSVAVAHH